MESGARVRHCHPEEVTSRSSNVKHTISLNWNKKKISKWKHYAYSFKFRTSKMHSSSTSYFIYFSSLIRFFIVIRKICVHIWFRLSCIKHSKHCEQWTVNMTNDMIINCIGQCFKLTFALRPSVNSQTLAHNALNDRFVTHSVLNHWTQ